MGNVIYKVLLIEDDKVDQAAFKRHIEKECLLYDHSIASSVSEAKKILSSEVFDVAIIDYRLGDGTAFDIIDLVASTPFIIVTEAGDEEVAVKAMKAGAHDYLIKDNERNYLKVLPVVIEKAREAKNWVSALS
ncbi:MAG: response regulator, partial [Planctomycetota bacterium]